MAESETPSLVFRKTSVTMRERFTPARACSTLTRMRASFRFVRFSAAVSFPRGGFFFQRPDTELDVRRFAIASFKLSQENRSLFLRSCFLHNLASVQRLMLAGWFSGCAIRQQIVGGKWPGMRNVCVQCED